MFSNVLLHNILQRVYHVIEAVQAVEGNRCVVGVLICSALFHSVCDLKAAQLNKQHSWIRKFLLCEFELSHNGAELTKNISCAKKALLIRVIRWLKIFRSGCNNLDDLAKSDKTKIVNSEFMPLAIKTNLASSTWRVSG